MPVARPEWTPQTDAQQRAMADVERATKHADEADEKLWEKVRAAHKLGVKPAYLAKKTGRARSTVYRHLDPEGGEDAPTA